jgi:hypothetical protein
MVLRPKLAGFACLLLAVAALPETARADDPVPRHTLSVGLDLGVRSARDDILVPRASTGPSVGFAGRFLGTVGSGIVDSGIRFGLGILLDRDGRPAVSLSDALRLGYLHIVRRSTDAWSVAVGPLLAWETDVNWFAKWDDSHAYWLGRRWLGAGARAWRRVSPAWRVDAAGELNLVGVEARPPAYRANKQDAFTHLSYYIATANSDAELGSILDWQALRIEVDLSRTRSPAPVAAGWSLGVEVRFAHTERPAMSFVVESNLRLAYAWSVR